MEYIIADGPTDEDYWYKRASTLEEARQLAPLYTSARYILEYRPENKGVVPTGRTWKINQPINKEKDDEAATQ